MISAFGDDAVFRARAELVEYWEQRNGELRGSGALQCDLHFDVIAEGRGRSAGGSPGGLVETT